MTVSPAKSSDVVDKQYMIKALLSNGIDRTTRRPIYLIWWAGYPKDEATWEDEENIDRGAVSEFKRSNKYRTPVNVC